MRTRTVLVVDSDPDTREMYAEYLTSRGYAVRSAATTDEACALPSTDAVVTGIMVEGSFDGVELIRRIRSEESRRHTVVVVVTACAFPRDEQRARSAGCDAFLTKPCFPETLVSELERQFAPLRSSTH